MIQRIQTLFLVIASLLLMLTMMIGIAIVRIESEMGSLKLYPDAIRLNGDEMMATYALLASITVGLSLMVYGILQYRNRKFQVNLIKVSVLSQLVFVVMVFFYYDKMRDMVFAQLGEGAEMTTAFSPLLSAPVVAIFLCMLAIRAIKKDEALVRSADRLR